MKVRVSYLVELTPEERSAVAHLGGGDFYLEMARAGAIQRHFRERGTRAGWADINDCLAGVAEQEQED